jgi:hypothetical protein
MKEIRIRRSEIERYRLRPGDVVLTEGGDFDKLGRGFIWRGEPEGCDHYHHCWNPVAEGECAELRGVAAELAKETEKLMAVSPTRASTQTSRDNSVPPSTGRF